MNFAGAYAHRRVFVTGHTGFKGSWLCEWLLKVGAEVHGYALPPPTEPALFGQLGLANRIASHVTGDVRDRAALEAALKAARPEYVFHLAAQPLVRLSYREPVETFAANVMGTVHLLDACRRLEEKCSVVCVTTDKVYENNESGRAYRETDPLGGYDPYSASKGACEIAISSYRRSFFNDAAGAVWVASARAGNVIGGGDWAPDRIVPDCMRALDRGETISVRNRVSTRPWQHVLEPLGGYLALGAALDTRVRFGEYSGGFNFGPDPASDRTVADLVAEILKHRSGSWVDGSDPSAVHEAGLLNLDIAKAAAVLGWRPRWNFETTVSKTVGWYEAVRRGGDAAEVTRGQITEYCGCAN
ncbi:MAG: CDP-glucose 4,6-dehydratase [Kiritimatiellae bacterium]|nr:CDP-glucose 4,6-dehydratase [Kiritimatiellia bacterium]